MQAPTAERPEIRVERLVVTTETCDRHPMSLAQFLIRTPKGKTLYMCGHCARKNFPEAPSCSW